MIVMHDVLACVMVMYGGVDVCDGDAWGIDVCCVEVLTCVTVMDGVLTCVMVMYVGVDVPVMCRCIC